MTEPTYYSQAATGLGSKRLQELKKDLVPRLEAIIEENLPGDFTKWDEENTSWEGDRKNVQNADKDPKTTSCAWRICLAADEYKMTLGFVFIEENRKALDQLCDGLGKACEALDELSIPLRLKLDQTASELLRDSTGADQRMPPASFTLRLVRKAVETAKVQAEQFLDKSGDQHTKANLRAAAVLAACIHVYEIRTGVTAPSWSRDDLQKQPGNEDHPRFTKFVKDVFQALGIGSRVDSAQRALNKLMILGQPDLRS